jgi:hypothetical protein
MIFAQIEDVVGKQLGQHATRFLDVRTWTTEPRKQSFIDVMPLREDPEV